MQSRVAHVIATYRQPALVERFIEGREVYVWLLGRASGPPEVLPFYEIDFSTLPPDRPRIVTFEGKWMESSVEYEGTKPVPCRLDATQAAAVTAAARGAWDALELRDYGRVDIRRAADGTPYVIDGNPNCDLSHEAGGFSRAARAGGLAYDEVVSRILELALARRQDADSTPLAIRSRGPQPPVAPAERGLVAGEPSADVDEPTRRPAV